MLDKGFCVNCGRPMYYDSHDAVYTHKGDQGYWCDKERTKSATSLDMAKSRFQTEGRDQVLKFFWKILWLKLDSTTEVNRKDLKRVIEEKFPYEYHYAEKGLKI